MKYFLIVSLVLFNLSLHAQTNDIRTFGNVSIEELKKNKYSLDSNANAICLLNVAVISFGDSYFDGSAISKHVRIKLLSKDAFELANIKEVLTETQSFENFKAQTIKLDESGKIKKIDIPENKIIINTLTDRFKSVSFTFPEVSEGCIIEYSYSLGSGHKYYFSNWPFQTELPTIHSQITMEGTNLKNLTTVIRGIDLIDSNTLIYNKENIKSYVVKNLAAWHNEPYNSSPSDYLVKLDFLFRRDTSVENWKYASKVLIGAHEFGDRYLKKSDYLNKIATKLCDTKNAIKPFDKMLQIRNYLSNWFTWDDKYSIICEDELYKIYDKRKGNSGEINFVLLNMLSNIGLDAKPALLRLRSHGAPILDIPLIQEFNHMIVVVTIGSEKYLMDATSKLPWNMLPLEFVDRDIVIIDEDDPTVLKIESFNTLSESTKTILQVQPNGTINGNCIKTFDGYAKVNELNKINKKGVDEYKQKITSSNIELDSFSVNSLRADSLPLITSINFHLANSENTNNKIYLNPIVIPFFNNPFKETKRKTDIDFGYAQSFENKVTVKFNNDYNILDYPKDVSIVSNDETMVFSRIAIPQENSIRFKYSININNKYYNYTSYPEVSKFYHDCVTKLNDLLILSKK